MRKFLALPLVLRWCVVGAALPSALWAVVVVIGTVAEGLDHGFLVGLEWMNDALGSLMIVIVVMGAPGALLGLVVGCVDLALGRRVERNGGSRRAVAIASTTMAAALMLASFPLQLLISSGLSVAAWFVTSAVFAAVPAAITCSRYTRVATRARSATIGPDAGPTLSA